MFQINIIASNVSMDAAARSVGFERLGCGRLATMLCWKRFYLLFNCFSMMLNDILEKYATEIHERNQDNLSISDLHSILFEFLEAVVDNQTRYDISMSGEMVVHKQGSFIAYDSVHS